ncbi:MAG: glycine oxidase ThiO [Candidatus Binatia bacterium]|nr:MAG: glycine oxidase ThiO [Candidatus Binatia bacterium]
MRTDAAVVGGGIIGSAIGYELARSGLSVSLFDSRALYGGATLAAAGLLVSGRGVAVGPLQSLTEESLALYPAWVAELERNAGVEVGFHSNAVLRVARNEREARVLVEAVERALQRGRRAQWLSPAAAAESEPLIEGVACVGAARFENEGFVNVSRLVAVLRAGIRRFGGVIFSSTVTRAVRTGPFWELKADFAEVQTEHLVLAGGFHSLPLAQQIGIALPLYPVRGLSFCVCGTSRLSRALTIGGLQIVPQSRTEVVVGSTVEREECRPAIAPKRLGELRDRSNAICPWLREGRVSAVRCGIRPASRIGRPIVGAVPGYANVVVAVGHYRSGLALAPLTAKTVQEVILGSPANEASRFFAWPRGEMR